MDLAPIIQPGVDEQKVLTKFTNQTTKFSNFTNNKADPTVAKWFTI